MLSLAGRPGREEGSGDPHAGNCGNIAPTCPNMAAVGIYEVNGVGRPRSRGATARGPRRVLQLPVAFFSRAAEFGYGRPPLRLRLRRGRRVPLCLRQKACIGISGSPLF